MNDVTQSVDVHVPLRTAYDQWTQLESFPHFMTGVVAVRPLDERRSHWKTEIAGTWREFDAEIVEQRPDECVAWRSVDGDVRHSGMVTFEPLAEGDTRVTVDLSWEPEGVVEKTGGALGVDRLQIKADLERFRRFVEERGAAAGSEGSSTDSASNANSTSTERPVGDVVSLLIAQHGLLKDLMGRVSAADGEEKRRLFGELVVQLKTHEAGEQRVVHPVTRSRVGHGAATADARLGEEQRADQLLAEAEAAETGPDSEEFDAWFERLRQAVLDHAAKEEREEFPKLRQELSPARLHDMAGELVAVQTAPR